MELSSPKLKKLLFFLKKIFSYISGGNVRVQKLKKKNNLEKIIIFWEMELSSSKLKKLLYFF